MAFRAREFDVWFGVRGVAPDGALLVDTGHGEVRVAAGALGVPIGACALVLASQEAAFVHGAGGVTHGA